MLLKAFIAIMLLIATADKAVALVVFHDKASFLAARPDAQGYNFPFPYLPDYPYDAIEAPNPYVVGPLTITSPSLWHYADWGHYLGGHRGITTEAENAYSLGFTYGSYQTARDVKIIVDGSVVAIDAMVDTGPSAFIGFISKRPIQYVTFEGGQEDDLYEVFVSSAVPEPAIWLQMIVGFGMVGYVVRRSPFVSARSSPRWGNR